MTAHETAKAIILEYIEAHAGCNIIDIYDHFECAYRIDKLIEICQELMNEKRIQWVRTK